MLRSNLDLQHLKVMLQHSAMAPLFNYKREHRYSEMCVMWRLDWTNKIKDTLDDRNLTLHLTWTIQIQNLVL